jgi:hypothetical protein
MVAGADAAALPVSSLDRQLSASFAPGCCGAAIHKHSIMQAVQHSPMLTTMSHEHRRAHRVLHCGRAQRCALASAIQSTLCQRTALHTLYPKTRISTHNTANLVTLPCHLCLQLLMLMPLLPATVALLLLMPTPLHASGEMVLLQHVSTYCLCR